MKSFEELEHLTQKDMANFWHRVNGLIKEYRYTQETVAASISVSYQTFRAWSHYKKYPDLIAIFHLAQVLGTSMNWLLFGVETEQSTRPAYIIGKHVLSLVSVLEKTIKLDLVNNDAPLPKKRYVGPYSKGVRRIKH